MLFANTTVNNSTEVSNYHLSQSDANVVFLLMKDIYASYINISSERIIPDDLFCVTKVMVELNFIN